MHDGGIFDIQLLVTDVDECSCTEFTQAGSNHVLRVGRVDHIIENSKSFFVFIFGEVELGN